MKILLENVEKYADPASVEEYEKAGGYTGLEKALRLNPEEVVEEVKKSGLRGRGGAGFPTGVKWGYTAPLKDEKYLICNGDEGEPGTFKDRILMEGDPHRVIEGILIAGYAIGAQKCYTYVRGEYHKSVSMLKRAVEEARKKGYLKSVGKPYDTDFEIEVRIGAGSYVCGEETALIQSLEGKRGNPRVRPPYPGTEGLWKRPSTVNNVETLANAPAILKNGAAWYKSLGAEKSPGTKLFCVSGKVNTPGCYELFMTTSLRELIYDHAGGIRDNKRFRAALVGGAASGGFMGEDALDVRLSFEDLAEHKGTLGSGAVLVLDEEVDILALLRNIMEFFVHESCGLCTPCRVGSVRILSLINKIIEGKGTRDDYERILTIARLMNRTSLCPLGQSPLLPLSTAFSLGDYCVRGHHC